LLGAVDWHDIDVIVATVFELISDKLTTSNGARIRLRICEERHG